MESIELVEDRQRALLEQLQQERRIMTNDAALELGVSVDTIRRDLRALHDRGLVHRVHGGAIAPSQLPSSFTGRSNDASPTQAVLAAAVVNRFRSGQLIGLDAGSTNVEIASQIPQSLEVTIITNSPPVAVALADHRAVDVVLLGGQVDLRWMAATGPEVVDAWRNHRLDLAVLGVCGFDPDSGASTRSRQEVATKRALISAAAETIVPLQAEKVGTLAPYVVADAAAVDTLIVEALCDDAMIQRCRQTGLDVSVA